MKITKFFIVLSGLLVFGILFFNGCEKDNGNAAAGKKSEEAVKLEELRELKQKEADSLKLEIESLREKRDSLKKATDDEQN